VQAIRMLLVGDNVDFVAGLQAWLTREADIEIVGIEHSAAAAIEKVAALRPQFVLMDVTMADMSGFEACRRIRSDNGAPLIVLMTFHESETVRRESAAAGADGVIGKGHIATTLLPLVRDLAGWTVEERADGRLLRKPEKPEKPQEPQA
jgi:DNA-binding NarL/FixJ family response regulator